MLIPIGTDIRTPRVPIGNYALIGLNVLVYLFTDVFGNTFSEGAGTWVKAYYALDAARPYLHQYVTYQFLHGDLMHLAGNMLFLWIFGNAVCDRMGSGPYMLFYVAGGVFAGMAFAAGADNPMVGASGAIAAVTTAFLALYPRVHITMLVWAIFIFTIQLPAMILIVFKIILWDNVIAPKFDQGAASNVAYSAHLGGYAFGFLVSLALLWWRALPRNQFDIVALWSRAGRRHGGASSGGYARPAGGRPVRVEEIESKPIHDVPLSPVERAREEVAKRLLERDTAGAVSAYGRLMGLDERQVLGAGQQIEVANLLAQARRYGEAARAYEAFLEAYPAAGDAAEVRLFLGLICSRYLREYARAVGHLRRALDDLRLEAQRTLAREELREAEARLSGGAGGGM
jgi:membrane associated rhomboid family serine protease